MSKIFQIILFTFTFGFVISIPQQQTQITVHLVNNNELNQTRMNETHHYNVTNSNGTKVNINEGVCYIEVPTISLVKDKNHVPTGNGTRPGYSRVRSCCRGFKRDDHRFWKCNPVCTKPCINANCTAPDTCTCIEGYVKDLSSACVGTCPKECLNGYCYGDQCVCNSGYVLEPEKKFCVPVCSNGCENGNCTAPEVCSCNNGFNLTPEGTCRADCENCLFGDCVGPHQCICRKGYKKNEENICTPICSKGCPNGICAAPELCACSYGFDLNEVSGRCEPKCLKPCINGFCSGPDSCDCHKGYILDPKDITGSVCLADCPQGCPNGVCSAPNFCLCNFGYVKDRNTKKCVKRSKRSLPNTSDESIKEKVIFEIPEEYKFMRIDEKL